MQKVALSHHARLEVARNAPGSTAKMKVRDRVEMQIDDNGVLLFFKRILI